MPAEARAQEPRDGEDVLPVRHGREHVLLDALAVEQHPLLVAARTEVARLAGVGDQRTLRRVGERSRFAPALARQRRLADRAHPPRTSPAFADETIEARRGDPSTRIEARRPRGAGSRSGGRPLRENRVRGPRCAARHRGRRRGVGRGRRAAGGAPARRVARGLWTAAFACRRRRRMYGARSCTAPRTAPGSSLRLGGSRSRGSRRCTRHPRSRSALGSRSGSSAPTVSPWSGCRGTR